MLFALRLLFFRRDHFNLRYFNHISGLFCGLRRYLCGLFHAVDKGQYIKQQEAPVIGHKDHIRTLIGAHKYTDG